MNRQQPTLWKFINKKVKGRQDLITETGLGKDNIVF